MPRRKRKPADDKVTAADVIEFIETVCFIPEGKLVGRKLELFDWQKDLIRLIYDNPHGTRRAIVSMGRKNAKTTLSACLLLAHLCGPPAKSKPNSQLYSAAQSRDQAGIIFSLAAKMVRLNSALARTVTIQETAKSLICLELGTRYRALSADATTAYGLSPQLVIHDELGQVRGPRSPLYEALETATGAQEDPLSIIISTQAPTDADLFSVLIGWRDRKWHVQPTFWLPSEGLSEKTIADRLPYDLWRAQGYLQTTPGRTVSYEHVADHLRGLFRHYNIAKIGFDRWNMRHFLPWLLKAGFSEQFVRDHFVEFGQGMQSMSPALRDLEQVLLEGQIAHGNHPVLSMCAANTVIAVDDAGNRKPSKKRSVGRIDGMVALAMAIGVAPLRAQRVIDIEALIG